MFQCFSFLIAFFCCVSGYGNYPQNTIPFFVDKPTSKQSPVLNAKSSKAMKYYDEVYSDSTLLADTDTFKNFPVEEVKNLLSIFKKDVCLSNIDGEFEMSLKIDISGKVLGIGASGETGFKAKIICPKTKN